MGYNWPCAQRTKRFSLTKSAPVPYPPRSCLISKPNPLTTQNPRTQSWGFSHRTQLEHTVSQQNDSPEPESHWSPHTPHCKGNGPYQAASRKTEQHDGYLFFLVGISNAPRKFEVSQKRAWLIKGGDCSELTDVNYVPASHRHCKQIMSQAIPPETRYLPSLLSR